MVSSPNGSYNGCFDALQGIKLFGSLEPFAHCCVSLGFERGWVGDVEHCVQEVARVNAEASHVFDCEWAKLNVWFGGNIPSGVDLLDFAMGSEKFGL